MDMIRKNSLVFGLLAYFVAFCTPLLQAEPASDLLQKGNESLSRNDVDGALTAFKDLVDKYPSTAAAISGRVNYGLAFYLKGQQDEAIKVLEPLLTDKLVPDDAKETATFYLAQACSGKNDYEKAQKVYTDFLTTYPKSLSLEDVLYGRAIARLMLGKHDDAVADLLDSQKRFPNSAAKWDTQYLIGVVYVQQAQGLLAQQKKVEADASLKKSFEALEKVVQASDEQPSLGNDALLMLGEIKFGLGEYDKAAGYYRRIMPRSDVVSKLEQRVQQATKSLQSNPSQFNQLQKLKMREESKLAGVKSKADPLIEALGKIAFCLVQENKFDEARAVANHALKFAATTEQNKFLLYQRTLSLAMQGQAEAAEKAFADFNAKFAKDSLAENIGLILGSKYLSQQKAEKALAVFEQAERDYPQSKLMQDVMMQVGEALRQLGRLDEAKRRMDSYLAKNPQSSNAEMVQFRLGATQLESKKYDDALKTFRDLAAKAKDASIKTQATFQIGLTLDTTQKGAEALVEYDKFIQVFPKDPLAATALFQSGLIQEKAGKGDDAIVRYAKIVQEFPQEKVAPYAQQAIAFYHMNAKPTRVNEALGAFDALFQKFKSSELAPPALFYQASILAQVGKTEEANTKYQQVLSAYGSEPIAADAQYAIAKLWHDKLLALGNYKAFNEERKTEWQGFAQKVLMAIDELVSKFPDSAPVSNGLSLAVGLQFSKIQVGIQSLSDAQEYFGALSGKAASNPPLAARINFAKAGLVYLAGDQKMAHEIMRSAYSESVQFSRQDLDRYGLTLIEAGDYAVAITVFSRLIKDYEKDPYAIADACYGLGTALLKSGRGNDAVQYFNRLKKDFAWSDKLHLANYNLGKSVEASKPDEALALYQEVMRARAAAPNAKADSMWAAAEIEEKRGRLAEAAGFYEAIDAFVGQLAGERASKGLLIAGQLYEKAGKTEDARRSYQSVLTSYESSPEATTAKSRLAALPAAAQGKK